MPALSTYDFSISVTRITVALIGIIGSIISFIVFSRKTFRNNSISTYSRALAVADCMVIIQLFSEFYRLTSSTSFINQSDFTCKIFLYVWMQYTSLPGWILTAFSIDKMLNMRTSPPKIIKSKLFQWSVVAGIVLFHMLAYSELLISLKLVQLGSSYSCNFIILDYYNIFNYAELTISGLIPFAVMLVTTIVTIRSLWKSRVSIERIGNADKQRKSRDIKYAVSSVIFNVVFVVLKIPFLIGPLLPNASLNSYAFYIVSIGVVLYLVNCSLTVFIHFATNSIFRREIFVLLGLNSSNRVSSTVNSVTNQIRMAPLQKAYSENK